MDLEKGYSFLARGFILPSETHQIHFLLESTNNTQVKIIFVLLVPLAEKFKGRVYNCLSVHLHKCCYSLLKYPKTGFSSILVDILGHLWPFCSCPRDCLSFGSKVGLLLPSNACTEDCSKAEGFSGIVHRRAPHIGKK